MNYLKKIKGLFGTCGDKLVKSSSAVYSVCITSILFMALMFWVQISHDAETLGLIKNNFDTRIELQQHKNSLSEQTIFINEGMDIIRKQGDKIREAEDIINSQNRAIGILIQKLQELDEWPLKPRPPLDPDKITRSEANFIQEDV